MPGVGNGYRYGLHGGQPEGEGPAVVLHQHGEEALHRAEEGAVHHEGPVLVSVLAHVYHAEALGHVEVKLHRRELPEPANRVFNLNIDLRSVKRCFIFDSLV